jgi:hypothetical protein
MVKSRVKEDIEDEWCLKSRTFARLMDNNSSIYTTEDQDGLHATICIL